MTDQPKQEGQSKTLLSFAGIKGALGFGPSKPEEPPPASQGELTQLEQDEEADLNPQQPAILLVRDPEPPRVRSRERTPIRQARSVTPQREVQQALPAPPVSTPEVQPTPPKAVTPHRKEPLTIEKLIEGLSGQQDTSALVRTALQPGSPVTVPQQPAIVLVRDPEPPRVRSRERTPVRQARSVTPQREVQQALPAIEDGTPPRKESEQELPRERERTSRRERSHERRKQRRSPSTSRDRSSDKRQKSPTPIKDRSHRSKKRSPSPKRGHVSEERQRSSTPPKERSHHRRRYSPSPVRDRASEEKRRSSTPPEKHRHGRRRRSPTPPHDHVSEERKSSPPPSREPSRERRRRKRTPEPSVTSREERRRSPSPNVVAPESPKVSSKKSKKSGKKEKKDSRSRRRTERVEPVEDRTMNEERSRSTRRPESSQVQPSQVISVEGSETDDRPPKDDRPVVTQDRPARLRPRFDPSREHAAAQRLKDKRKVVQPQREHRRDPGTDGPPDTEDEVRQRRRFPPPPPPATSNRQSQLGQRPLAFAKPPPPRESATESSQISERQPLRLRSQETLPQRPMPKRVLATSTVGGSAPPRLQDTSGRAARGSYHDQSQVRDDRTYGPQYQQERQEWGSSQRRVPSMGRRESLHAWAGHQYPSQRYQDWSQQPPSTQEYWHDPQQGHPQHYPQQSAAAQHWQAPQQQLPQQLPVLPAPVYPPGMQPSVQPPPGLGPNIQRNRPGVMSQGVSVQYASAASRQQSPVGSQPPQDRQQSSYSQQYPSTGGYFRQGYQ